MTKSLDTEEPPVLFPDGVGSVSAADIGRNRDILAAVSSRIDRESGGRQTEEKAEEDTPDESKQREEETEVREEGESSCPNVAAVARFIEARERRDADGARETLHDDVCLIKPDFKMKGFAPPKPQLLPGPKRFGKDVVLSYFDEEEFDGRTVCDETGRTLNAVVYHRRGSEGVKGESREVRGAVEYVRFSKKDARKSVGVAWHKISLLMKQIFTVKDGRILKIEVVVLNPDLISWSGKFYEFEDECFAEMMKEALVF